MKNNTLALAAGILSSVFMAANPAWAQTPEHGHDPTPSEMLATQKKLAPVMTVRARMTQSPNEPLTMNVGDNKMFRTLYERLRRLPGAQIELDGAVITEDKSGYISVFEGWDFSGMDLSGTTIRNAVFFQREGRENELRQCET